MTIVLKPNNVENKPYNDENLPIFRFAHHFHAQNGKICIENTDMIHHMHQNGNDVHVHYEDNDMDTVENYSIDRIDTF